MRYLLTLFFLVITFSSYATVFFYRFDTRPPSLLFNEGIPNLGENEDLLLHVEGASCYGGTDDSIFTAVSQSFNTAYQFAQNYWGQPGQYLYIYRIRPDSNFYSVYGSLLNQYEQTGRRIFIDSANAFEYENEYVAYGGVENTNIHSVIRYRYTGFNEPITRIDEVTNPRYLDINTSQNTIPFTFSHDSSSDRNSLCPSCISIVSSLSLNASKRKEDLKECEISRIALILLQ